MIYLTKYQLENSRADRQTEHILGRKLLEHGLLLEYGASYPADKGENGKPYIKSRPDIQFNISHTKGLVVCGIAPVLIGLDVEYIRKYSKQVMKRICTDEEQSYIDDGESEECKNERFFRLWTLKESYIKAIGRGLSFPMKEIYFYIGQGKAGSLQILGNISGWQFAQARIYDNYILSLCLQQKMNTGNTE